MTRRPIKDWFLWFAPTLIVTALVMGFITRILLILNPLTVVDFSLWQWLKIFLLGALNDAAFAAIALIPAFVLYTGTAKGKYGKAAGWTLWGILLAATLYFLLFNDISDEYGGPVPIIVNVLMSVLLICFSIKWFAPKVRDGWRYIGLHVTVFVYAFLMVMNIVSEYTFWDEFGVRYNFIAVDYLVYTNEVVGNIMESYNMPLIVAGALLLGALVYWLMTLRVSFREAGVASLRHWGIQFAVLAAVALGGGCWLHHGYRNWIDRNVFVTELQENGCWCFLEAYNSNELDFKQFYRTLDDAEVMKEKCAFCGQDSTGVQHIIREGEAIRKNIVLITVESLSGDFLARFGSQDGITPHIDSLARLGISFDQLFATGNRTVRGLEAVTLCIPPSAGESLVKRPDCGGRFSTAEILQREGYTTRYLYGGDSYFDNMSAFFGAYGYEITDRKSYLPGEITFANIWGTCDEDSYKVALRLCDADYENGRPFFTHIMTISNHRPYTYPDGRIQYKGNPMSRRAAVKYTDYAIGAFFAEAAARPWFGDTVFVIVADHCASSAGKTSLPLECYHIPAVIYAPGFIEPQTVEKTCSQIDLMPTLLSLLNFSYDSRFYGQDVLDDRFKERAFMATYQDLGYYADGILTVLSPVRQARQYAVSSPEPWRYTEDLLETPDEGALREAVVFYQAANTLSQP